MKTKKKDGKAAVEGDKKGDRPPEGGRGGPIGHTGWGSFEQRRKAVKLTVPVPPL